MATETTNYKFIKDAPNEYYDVAKVNANLDKIDAAIEGALDKANQAFQSASDGKTAIANSITAKGVLASKEDTFPTLASKIDSIETDKTGDATATAADILAPKDAYVKGQKIKGTIPSKGAATITPSTSAQTIAANQYLSGAQTIAGVSVPVANVLAGVTIAGAVGTMPNRGALNQTITSNNGQVNIAAGYYSDGVIKAIFANLVAGNIKSGVNIGGVVGTLVDFNALVLEVSDNKYYPGDGTLFRQNTVGTVSLPPGIESYVLKLTLNLQDLVVLVTQSPTGSIIVTTVVPWSLIQITSINMNSVSFKHTQVEPMPFRYQYFALVSK